MEPRSERGKLLLTGVLSLHLLVVVDGLAGDWIPGGSAWRKLTRTSQSWEMFSRPRPRGWTIEVYGHHADGERRLLIESPARDTDDHALLYTRTVKVTQNLAKKGGAKNREHLARRLCELDDSLQAVEIEVLQLDRPRKREYRQDPDAAIEWKLLSAPRFECAR